MKKKFFVLFNLLIVLLLTSPAAWAEELSAKEIVDKALDHNFFGFKEAEVDLKMDLHLHFHHFFIHIFILFIFSK